MTTTVEGEFVGRGPSSATRWLAGVMAFTLGVALGIVAGSTSEVRDGFTLLAGCRTHVRGGPPPARIPGATDGVLLKEAWWVVQVEGTFASRRPILERQEDPLLVVAYLGAGYGIGSIPAGGWRGAAPDELRGAPAATAREWLHRRRKAHRYGLRLPSRESSWAVSYGWPSAPEPQRVHVEAAFVDVDGSIMARRAEVECR